MAKTVLSLGCLPPSTALAMCCAPLTVVRLLGTNRFKLSVLCSYRFVFYL